MLSDIFFQKEINKNYVESKTTFFPSLSVNSTCLSLLVNAADFNSCPEIMLTPCSRSFSVVHLLKYSGNILAKLPFSGNICTTLSLDEP